MKKFSSPALLFAIVVLLAACQPTEPPVDQHALDTIQAEQRQQEESSAMRAKILSAHRTLSSEQMKHGLLYMAGGGEDPFGVYYLSNSGTGALITALDMDAWARTVKLQGTELAFVASNGDIGFYDLGTGERRSVAVASDAQEDCAMNSQVPVRDFLIKGATIFVIVDGCDKDGAPMSELRSFDTVSQKSRVIADVTAVSIDGAGIVFVEDKSTDKKIRLKSVYGDAGVAVARLYDVNVGTQKVTLVADLTRENCDAPSVCDAKVLRANMEYAKYLPETSKTQCGAWTIEQQGDMIIHGADNTAISVSLASLVACLEQ